MFFLDMVPYQKLVCDSYCMLIFFIVHQDANKKLIEKFFSADYFLKVHLHNFHR
jgi:hypothetical protein